MMPHATAQVGGNDRDTAMPDQHTTAELARQIGALEERQASDRRELRDDLRVGFHDIKAMISELSFVSPGVYVADQLRQDEVAAALEKRIEGLMEARRDDIQARRDDRKLIWGALVAPIIVALVLYVLVGAGVIA
jgi:hypothetical protein